MKLKYILGILAILLLAVGTASALPYYGDLNTVSSGGSTSTLIHVYYDASTGQIQFVDATPGAGYSAGTGGDGIIGIAIYKDVTIPDLTAGVPGSNNINPGWTLSKNTNGFDGFHPFNTEYYSDASHGYQTVSGTLSPAGDLTWNNAVNGGSYSLAVHYRLNSNIYQVTYFVANKTIPEFPTMAVPVAAVLGLLFISQRKRKEE